MWCRYRFKRGLSINGVCLNLPAGVRTLHTLYSAYFILTGRVLHNPVRGTTSTQLASIIGVKLIPPTRVMLQFL